MTHDTITSPANPLIKTLRSLERKKGRTETGLFLAEGARLVSQGLERGWTAETLLISSTATKTAHIADLAGKAEAAGTRVIKASSQVMSKITRKDNPQTVAAAFQQRTARLGDLRQKAGLWIALFEVRDPGNLGTILRTADCAGVNGVVLLETCCDPFSIEAVRASMGSIFDCQFARASFSEFNTWRRTEAMALFAASVNGTMRHTELPVGKRTALLMGNEQSGLPIHAEAACDALARIPMRGGADSLNLAQAMAIMTYDAWRQLDFAT